MGIEVRPARREEYDAAGALTLAAYRHDGFVSATSDYVHELGDAAARASQAELLVAVDGGAVVGTVTFCPPGSPWREIAADDEGEFRMLAVDPAARRRGTARALVQRCIDRGGDLGLSGLVMSSDHRMTNAQALYDDLGFVRLPERDWSPVPGIRLLAFGRRLEPARNGAAT